MGKFFADAFYPHHGDTHSTEPNARSPGTPDTEKANPLHRAKTAICYPPSALLRYDSVPRGGRLHDDKENSPGDRGRLYRAGRGTLFDSQCVAGRSLRGERDALANPERHAAPALG